MIQLIENHFWNSNKTPWKMWGKILPRRQKSTTVCALKPHSNVKSEGDFGQISKYDCLIFDIFIENWTEPKNGSIEPGFSVLTKQI